MPAPSLRQHLRRVPANLLRSGYGFAAVGLATQQPALVALGIVLAMVAGTRTGHRLPCP